jgi:hypothetical protein
MEIKMEIAVAELKWFQFRQRIIGWRKKRREDQLATLERAEERSIKILQKRYGYTKEQARIELRKHYSNAWLG